MRFKNNKILKKIRKRLVKKVTMEEVYTYDDHLHYKLVLKNFWNLKNIRVNLMSRSSLEELPYKLERNLLSIKVPIDYIKEDDSKFNIKLIINDKVMWIKPSDSFLENNRNIMVDDKCFYTIVHKKNIIIRRKFEGFSFTSQKVFIESIKTKYSSIYLKMNASYNSNDFEVYAFNNNNNKYRVLEAEYIENDTFILNDFRLFSIGTWQLFIKIEDQMHPLALNDNTHQIFDTFGNKVRVLNEKAGLYLIFSPHKLTTEVHSISLNSNGFVKMEFGIEDLKSDTYNYLVVKNITTDEHSNFQIIYDNEKWKAELPVEELIKDSSKKSFFIVEEKDNPIQYQFDILKEDRGNTISAFNEIFDSQKVSFAFYRRKDKSLGFKIAYPKLRKLITEISNFTMNGYVRSLDKFVDCKAYLYIEDRNTFEFIRIPVEERFNINLLDYDLVSLKGKEKTVMDFYIVIVNNEDEIIRKEKIKYKYSDYKKDNYYDYTEMKDEMLNQHHFLITTTPFNNLKIESFSIPNYIHVPDDTSQKDRNVWLVGERYNTAQDNGFALFKWLRENTTIDAYYVIEKDAEDYVKIQDIPNVLTFGSEKHYEIAFKAKVLLGTHDLENILPYKPARGFFHYENTFRVFLQHGVLGRKNVEYHKKYYDLPFHLFIVSSDAEKYDIVVDQLGYDEDEVAITGLARFDNLIQESEPKDILLMPTWRDWINTDQQFLESEYYLTYANLIKNEKLLSLLEQHNVNLNFYPHYRSQVYFNKDIADLSDRVHFIPLGSISVQQLLKDHALLITDFSSVSFDFTLMNKPVIYYHFDVQRFFRKGILRPVEETFLGRIANTEDELVELIEERLNHNFENYDMDITNIIKYQDKHNSERIYQSVIDKME